MKASGRPTISRTVSYRWSDLDAPHASVTDIQQFDVLCCEKINNPKSDGNKRFAALLAMSCREYVAVKSACERKRIVGSVVNSFILHSRAPGGRFLRSTSVNDEYIILSRKDAVEWVYKELQQVLGGDIDIVAAATPTKQQERIIPPTQNEIPVCGQHAIIEEESDGYELPRRTEAIEIDKTVENILKGQKTILTQMTAQGKFKLDITKRIPTALLPWSSTTKSSHSSEDTDSSTEPISETKQQECDTVQTETLPSQDEMMTDQVPSNAIEDRVAKILQNQKSILSKMSDQGKFREATMKLITSELSTNRKVAA